MEQSLTILRLPRVCELTGLSRSTIYAAIKAGTFPAQFRLGPRAIGFSAAAVESWLSARMAGKPDPEVRALVKNLNASDGRSR